MLASIFPLSMTRRHRVEADSSFCSATITTAAPRSTMTKPPFAPRAASQAKPQPQLELGFRAALAAAAS
jgi:hypothetical protein